MSWKRPSLLVAALSTSGLVLGLFFGYKAFAAPQAISLTTSPVLLNLSVKPGSVSTQTIELMNNSAQPININMKLMTFGSAGTTGQPQITNFSSGNPETTYVKFNPNSFTAQPKVWSKVQVTFSLPPSANLGYYYALVFSPVYNQQTNPNGAVFHGSNAVLALLNTNSANEKQSVQVASFTVSKRIYQYLPANFSVNVHNNGNIYIAPKGDIFITRTGSGQSLAALQINSGGGNVLPNSNRVFTANWTDGFPVYTPIYKNGQPVVDKNGNPVNKLSWNFSKINKFRFGRYYANLVMTYTSGGKTVILSGKIDFWVIPWFILLIILAIIVIILLNIFFISRSIYRKIQSHKAKNSK